RGLAEQERLQVSERCDSVALIRCILVGLNLLKESAHLDAVPSFDQGDSIGDGVQVPGDVVKLLRAVSPGAGDGTKLTEADRANIDIAYRLALDETQARVFNRRRRVHQPLGARKTSAERVDQARRERVCLLKAGDLRAQRARTLLESSGARIQAGAIV